MKPYGFLEEKLCSENTSLWERLQRIKTAAAEFWKEKKLRWYTDHGIEHSRSILDMIERMLHPMNVMLSAEELYILISASYLHDIGMQDLRISGAEGALNAEQEKIVRRTHPERSVDLILDNAIYLGTDNSHRIPLDIPPDFIGPVSLVVRAHGTDFFFDSVMKLNRNHFSPGGKDFKGPFLAALLLMADELDLHEKRSAECLEPSNSYLENFAPESLLHIYKHHYIRKVSLEGGITNRTIRLTFAFPDESPTYESEMVSWVVAKLRKQIQLTQEIFSKYDLRWNRTISVRYASPEFSPRLRIPDNAVPYLHQEICRMQLIDRRKLINELTGHVKNGIAIRKLIFVKCMDQSDEATIIEWLFYICQCHKVHHDGMDFEPIDSFTVNDLKERIEIFLQKGLPGIFVASGIHNISNSDVSSWLYGKGVEMMTSVKDIPILVIFFTRDDQCTQAESLSEYILDYLTEDDLRQHFEDVMGCSKSRCEDLVNLLDPAKIPPEALLTSVDRLRKNWTRAMRE
jgi:hypothetical protein